MSPISRTSPKRTGSQSRRGGVARGVAHCREFGTTRIFLPDAIQISLLSNANLARLGGACVVDDVSVVAFEMLAPSGAGQEDVMNTQKAEFTDTDMGSTARRLDQIGWGIFLVMIGVIWLVPGVPQGTWLIGTGILLLGLNAIRSRLGIHWSGVSVALGVLTLAAGLGDFTGIKLPLFPICLVIIGATLILKPLVSQRA
jgi:hypothetical protein